jgi:hypothetical protein
MNLNWGMNRKVYEGTWVAVWPPFFILDRFSLSRPECGGEVPALFRIVGAL